MTVRAPPLWIPAFAGTTMGDVRADKGCWWEEAATASAARLRRGVGSGMRRGLVVGGPPRGGTCPLRFPSGRTDAGRIFVFMSAHAVRVERPFDGSGNCECAPATGSAGRGDKETPRAAPRPWIPAFAGTTMWVGGSAGAAGGVGVRVPLRRDGRFAKRPYDGVWGSRRRRGLVVGDALRQRSGRTDSCLRERMTTWVGESGMRRGCWWWGALRQAQGERNSRCGRATGCGVGVAARACIWWGLGRRRCGEGYSSGRGIQRALKSWG